MRQSSIVFYLSCILLTLQVFNVRAQRQEINNRIYEDTPIINQCSNCLERINPVTKPLPVDTPKSGIVVLSEIGCIHTMTGRRFTRLPVDCVIIKKVEPSFRLDVYSPDWRVPYPVQDITSKQMEETK